ncbi:MAG: DUF4160 domain-containing protein [Mesorhizobium sp.]|nr:DUF4160 domain-containing protein [Mesorhizobium sp.]MBN9241715.1 DUF4160 domain-containing protein [Mesorhizobium sp.]
MVTIHRQYGLRVVISVDDHEPAHVHVFGDGQAKINLADLSDRPKLIWTDGMAHAEARSAMQVVVENQSSFLRRWEEIHG